MGGQKGRQSLLTVGFGVKRDTSAAESNGRATLVRLSSNQAEITLVIRSEVDDIALTGGEIVPIEIVVLLCDLESLRLNEDKTHYLS